jgi:hypothetical protein
MTISLDADRRLALVTAVRDFISPPPTARRRHHLRTWLHLLGWISWALNVCPLLRPALSSSYHKTAGKTIPYAPVPLNAAVISDFAWFADTFDSFPGIHILRLLAWVPGDADLQIYCDASLSGLGFWSPSTLQGFVHRLPSSSPSFLTTSIFWLEALCVASAVEFAASLSYPPSRLAIFTDNLDTVQIFDLLHAMAPPFFSPPHLWGALPLLWWCYVLCISRVLL